MRDNAMPDMWRDVIAAPGGQANCLAILYNKIDLSFDHIPNLLVRMAVDGRGNACREPELYQHHTAAIAQDPALGALRRREGRLVGGICGYFHALLFRY